jgi:hypothetical protein
LGIPLIMVPDKSVIPYILLVAGFIAWKPKMAKC